MSRLPPIGPRSAVSAVTRLYHTSDAAFDDEHAISGAVQPPRLYAIVAARSHPARRCSYEIRTTNLGGMGADD